MLVRIRGDEVEEVQFKIFEPPRFFEALLRGRQFTEAPDITARICGICPIAYIASSCNAMEALCGVELPEQVRLLRRLVYCGEWIESHVLHTAMLHAPDFLGYDGAVEMARDRRDLVETALRLKKAGNTIMDVVGGRAVHPVNLRVGGMYRAPSRAELAALVPELEWAREAAVEFTRWVAGFDFPDFEQDYAFVALRAAGRVRDRARPDRLEHGPRHRRLRVRGAFHRDARRAFERAALDACRRRQLSRRPSRTLRAQFGRAVAARPGDRRRRSGLGDCRPQPVPQHRRSRRRDRLRRRRGAAHHRAVRAARAVVRRGGAARRHRARLHRGSAWDLLASVRDRRRTATILDAKIVPPTSQNQKTIEEDLRRRRQAVAAPARTTSSRTAASRRSATTTPASPAQPISSSSRSSARERRPRVSAAATAVTTPWGRSSQTGCAPPVRPCSSATTSRPGCSTTGRGSTWS